MSIQEYMDLRNSLSPRERDKLDQQFNEQWLRILDQLSGGIRVSRTGTNNNPEGI